MSLESTVFMYSERLETYEKYKCRRDDSYSTCINNMSYEEIKTGFLLELTKDLKEYEKILSRIELIQNINININVSNYLFQIIFYTDKENSITVINLTNGYCSIKNNGEIDDVLLDKKYNSDISIKDIENIISAYSKIKYCIKDRLEEELIKQLEVIDNSIERYSNEQDIYSSMIENYEKIRTSIKDNELKNNSNENYDYGR
mgnify:CR=1 FL=1